MADRADVGQGTPERRPSRAVTVAECRALPAGKTLTVARGLLLVADEHGARWIFRFTSRETGKRRDCGLGPFPDVGLKEARDRAEDLRAIVRQGRDPIEDRRRASEAARAATAAEAATKRRDEATLQVLARRYHADIRSSFRNRKHAAQWISSLEMHVFPTLGARPISAVTVTDLLDLLKPLQDRVPETAKRVRERLAAVFAHAALRGLCTANPAEIVRPALKTRKGEQAHHRALAFARVPTFVAELREFTGAAPVVRLALEILILTASRSGEARGARWSEFDREAGWWSVPAERMKAGQEHRVPLPPRALAILKEVRPWSDGKPGSLVFPGRERDKPLSDMTLTAILRRMPTGARREDGEDEVYADLATTHGFRTAFSSWAREKTRFRVDVIEAALAHREKDRVAAAYSHLADYRKDRIALATAWAQYVTGGTAKVVPIRTEAAM